MSITLSALQKQRTDTAASWTAENPTLLAGELGFESDTGKAKLGTGSTAWNSLGYLGLIPSSGIYPLSQLLMPLGSQSAPSLAFTGDVNTGLYSPGADQLALATNGQGRLFVNSSGNVGIQRSAPDNNLSIGSTGSLAQDSNSFYLGSNFTGTGANFIGSSKHAQRLFFNNASGNGFLSYSNTSSAGTAGNPITWEERFRVTSDGKVGVGTSSPGSFNSSGNNLVVSSSGAAGITINAGATDSSNIFFADSGNNTQGQIRYFHSSDSLSFGVNGGDAVRINSSGNVGIGTTSPGFSNGDGLEIQRDGTACLRLDDNTNSKAGEIYADSTGLNIDARGTSAVLNFDIGGSTKATLDNSGRLLVGTSSDFSGSTNGLLQATSGGGAELALGRTSTSALGAGSGLGRIKFYSNSGSVYEPSAEIACLTDATQGSGDKPGRLVFSTTADGASSPTERMRIVNDGRTDVFATAETLRVRTAATTAAASIAIRLQAAATTMTSGGTTEFQVTSNGNVANTNNAYGAISDIKLKENIVDANSQWDDLKALQVRNYNFKEGQTHTQIGLVAQEAELVSPGLVSESPDRDEDGNDLGTVTKSVNYSVLYMKSVKALQEAMERIEQLEAKVAALEAS